MKIRDALALGLSSVLVWSTIGCQARTVSVVDLAPLPYAYEGDRIPGVVELCLPPQLRMRQWNVSDHPYIIELGSRAALNVERLAKAAFEEVVVSFTSACGSATDRPWFTARIVSANRDWDGAGSEPVDTAVTMEFKLVGDDGERLWSTTTTGEYSADTELLQRRKEMGRHDFGVALRKALEQGFDEVMRSDDIRRAVGS